MIPYGLAVLGTVAVAVLTRALRPPAPERSIVGLATAAVFGTYVFFAGLAGAVWSVGGLSTDTGVSDSRWLIYLVISLAALAGPLVLAIRILRRPSLGRISSGGGSSAAGTG